MHRGRWAEDPAALFAKSRRGVISVARLEELGVPRRTCYRRCRPGQPWQRLLPGVLLLRAGEPTRRQLVEAALSYAGHEAVVTGAEACRRHGLKDTRGDAHRVHLLVPDDRHPGSTGYVVVERTSRMPEAVSPDGVPLAPLTRAVLDECRRLTRPDDVRAMLAEAVQRFGADPMELAAELENGSSRGSSVPRDVLRSLLRGARSVAEVDGMGVWRRTGLPEPLWNFELRDERGKYVATPDAWCDEVGLAWEIDSYEYHFGKDGYAASLARNTRYAASGVTLVQSLPSRLRFEPRAVAAELVAAYRAAAARPAVRIAARRE